MKDHLALYVSSEPDTLLFAPARGGCHLNDRVFNKDVFQKAAKDVGREDLSGHDLRRFAGSKNAQVATLTENMARFGHKAVKASLLYQHSPSGRDAEIASELVYPRSGKIGREPLNRATNGRHGRRAFAGWRLDSARLKGREPMLHRMATFALVHGAWHGAWCWELLTPFLKHAGHDVVAPELPIDDGSADYDAYADAICRSLKGRDDDVVGA